MLLSFCAVRLGAHMLPLNPGSDASRIRPGMTADEVRALMGPPKRVAREILYRRYLEFWTYERPQLIWIEFRCEHGQDPRVANVHRTGATLP